MKTNILLSDISSGEHFPSAPDEAVKSNSGDLWKGFRIEHHVLPSSELPEHQVIDHRLMINIGEPVLFESKIDNKLVKQVYQYGDFKLLAHQAHNEPRWYNELNMLAVAIDPDFTRQVTEKGNIDFLLKGKHNDPLITSIAESLFIAF
jgi:hypothetical protein